jgi:adenylate cyclase
MPFTRQGALRLRPSIVMLFIVMVLPIFCIAIWVGYVSNDRMARDAAQHSVERARQETIAQTEALLHPIASLVRVSAAVASRQADFYRTDKAAASMMEVLDHSANISSVYVGFADGSYRMALRVPAGLKVHNAPAPQGTQFAHRWIDRSAAGAGAADHYTFLDGKRQPAGTASAPAVYDPRVRPWYKDASERRDLVTSDPYIYATTGLPGITIAMPFYIGGQLGGVLAIDILLDSLSQYLKTRPVSANSISLVVDRQGLVVAHPDVRQALRREASGGLSRVRINELSNPLPALAFAMRADEARRQQPQFGFEHEGAEHVAIFSPFPESFGKPWDVVIVAPLKDFLGQAQENNRKLLLFGLAAIALQVVLIYVLSRRIARPLEQLERQVQQVQNFRGREGEPVRTPIREIAALATAVDTLHGAITAFSAFVPRDLVRTLVAADQKLELGGRSRYLTMMFTDLESFSTLAETTPAQELMVRLSAYFEVVTRAIGQEHGTLDKFIGDGVMAFWGAPALLEDHAFHACAAALRIEEGMNELNSRWAAQGLAPLNVRIGIHTDAVLVGNIGSPERMSYTVMGDGVNVAARLEALNKEHGTRICISHNVYREAGERLRVRPMGQATVKGRRGELQVYELLAIRAAGQAAPAAQLSPASPEALLPVT